MKATLAIAASRAGKCERPLDHEGLTECVFRRDQADTDPLIAKKVNTQKPHSLKNGPV
jgi:predicted nucleotide-binding protein